MQLHLAQHSTNLEKKIVARQEQLTSYIGSDIYQERYSLSISWYTT